MKRINNYEQINWKWTDSKGIDINIGIYSIDDINNEGRCIGTIDYPFGAIKTDLELTKIIKDKANKYSKCDINKPFILVISPIIRFPLDDYTTSSILFGQPAYKVTSYSDGSQKTSWTRT